MVATDIFKRTKSGGRIKGTPNKNTRIKRQVLTEALMAVHLTKAQLEELSPLDILRRCMREFYWRGDFGNAAQCASLAAPYVHSRLAQTDINVNNNNVYAKLSDDALAMQLAELALRQSIARDIDALPGSVRDTTPVADEQQEA